MTGLGQVADQVPGDLGDKGVAWVLGDPEEVGPPAGVLDGEQDVEALEDHGVDGEEVCRQDALGLGPEELGPGRASARCRPQAMAAEDAPYRRRSDPDAELGSSPWMRTQPQLRFSRPRRKISSTSSALIAGRPRPRCRRHARHLRRPASSVPTEQGLRRDQESLASGPAEAAG